MIIGYEKSFEYLTFMTSCSKLDAFLLFYLSFICIVFLFSDKVNSHDYFDVNTSGSKSLICYQCNSTSKEDIPSCQIGYFKFNKPWQKIVCSFQCPAHIADFCFLIEENFNGEIKTARGCYNSKDKNGRNIKPGCSVEENKTMCFCKQRLCNSSPSSLTLCCFNYLLIVICYVVK